MLLQTNSYIVPPEKRAEHARLMRRFRQALHQVGCDNFEVYEQVGANWGGTLNTGRFVQIMRFRDRKHQLAVQNAERSDAAAQALIAEFCELINYPYQQQQQQFVVGFYASALPVAPLRGQPESPEDEASDSEEPKAGGTGEEPSAAGDIAAAAAETAAAGISDAGHGLESSESIAAHLDNESNELLDDEATPVLVEEDPSEIEAAASPETPADHPSAYFDHPTEPAANDETPATEESALVDIFDQDDAEAFAEEHTPEPVNHEPAPEGAPHESESESAQPELEKSAHTDSDLEADLAIDVDDISRLAEELAAGDDELEDPRHPDPARHHGQNRSSGNGAH